MMGSITKDLPNPLQVAHALTWRYVIALLLVVSLSTAAWLSLHQVIAEQKSTASLVNISGRQRMLSQRTALFCNLLVNSPSAERMKIRKQLSETIELMEVSHHNLIHGDLTTGLPETHSAVVHALYFDGPDSLDRQVTRYVSTVHALLQLSDAELTADNASLHYITATATTTLLTALDKMVAQYQREGEASVTPVQNAETIFWLATLLLLLLEAALIYHPFVRHVRFIIGKLQDASAALQLHHDQLEETVQQRTAELEHRSHALEESEEKFRLISTNAKEAIVIINSDEQIVYWNPAAEQIFGFLSDEVIGKNLHDLLTPENQRAAATSSLDRFRNIGVGRVIGTTIDITALRKNGEEFPVELSISAFMFQNSWHALGIIRDITERKQLEEQILQLAFYDPLTNLPNRRLLNDRLDQAMTACRRTGYYGALLFLDLDNFKSLNDVHGHGLGDLLLTEAANRLKHSARERDTVARLGGDEFVVILTELDEDEVESIRASRLVAEKIRSALSKPYLLHNDEGKCIEHHCTVSIGIALFSRQQRSEIMMQADKAMYQAKEAGRNQVRMYGPRLASTSATP